jgi:hypothetical protein
MRPTWTGVEPAEERCCSPDRALDAPSAGIGPAGGPGDSLDCSMLSDVLGESQMLRGVWTWARRILPDTGNLPYSFGWTESRGRRYLRTRPDAARARPIVFCANSGRAGSAFLAQLLGQSPSVMASHEPRPRMTGSYLRMVRERPMKEHLGRRALKVWAVDRRVRHLPSETLYVETTNMFIKTFWDVALMSWEHVHIVALRRDPVKTLKSFMELGFFHERNPSWPLWMSDPVGPNRVVQPLWEAEGRPAPGMPGGPDATERSIAYLVEIEGRLEMVTAIVSGDRSGGPGAPRGPFPNVRVLETTLDELLKPEGRHRLIDFLGLPSTELVPPAPENTREAWKSYFRDGAVPDSEPGRRIEEYRARAEAAGLALPGTVRAW